MWAIEWWMCYACVRREGGIGRRDSSTCYSTSKPPCGRCVCVCACRGDPRFLYCRNLWYGVHWGDVLYRFKPRHCGTHIVALKARGCEVSVCNLSDSELSLSSGEQQEKSKQGRETEISTVLLLITAAEKLSQAQSAISVNFICVCVAVWHDTCNAI